MVSFSCEVCNETLAKKKLMGHFNRCPDAYFTCIDCSTTFEGDDFKNHTTCITEKEKYEKGYAKKQQQQHKQQQRAEEPTPKKVTPPSAEKKTKSNELIPKGKSMEFSKVLKKLKKQHSKDKKELLRDLKVVHNSNGELVLKLADL